MTRPKMILFDYGHTLLAEPGYDGLRGNRAVMEYANKNPQNITPELSFLKEHDIRTGVISNIGFSGNTLKNRINSLLPDNNFEFIIASSEYMIRKPNPMLFELALCKAGLPSDDVWYCGDSVTADVEGSAAVGIFPIWYENFTIENPFREKNHKEVNCRHLHIHDWRELIKVLEKLA